MADYGNENDYEETEMDRAGSAATRMCSEAFRKVRAGAPPEPIRTEFAAEMRRTMEGYQLEMYLRSLDQAIDQGLKTR